MEFEDLDLIKRVHFKENVWNGTKKTVHNNECPYKAGVRKAGFHCIVLDLFLFIDNDLK